MSGSLSVGAVMMLLDAAAAEHGDRETETRKLLAGLGLARTETDQIGDRLRHLRTNSERWRRRGQELAALFSSARELAQLRDVDALLERLVERAHDLVGTDVTYLSEFDVDTRELRVRTTLGTVSPSFLGLRVPPGMGLASMVVDSRSPQWTSHYATMTQAPHDATIDATVAGEGLVSLLGVPLLAGDEVIGVLFAANRVEHAFSPEEISLLSAFADHAAVVLQTARLLARTQDAAEETKRAYGELARHVEAMERASGVHTDLTSLVLQGGDALDVAAALGRVLRCRVTILDTELAPAAPARPPSTGPAQPDQDSNGPARETIRRAAAESRRSGRCVAVGGPHPGIAVAVVAGAAFLGALVLEQGEVEFGPVEYRTAERAAQITALLRLKQDALIEAERRIRGDLLADLLSDDAPRRARVAERALARGIRVDELRSLVVVSVPPEHRRQAGRAAAQVVAPNGLVGEHAQWIVALSPVTGAAVAARQIRGAVQRATEGTVIAVGADLPRVPADLRDQLEAAAGCARILPSIGLADAAVTTDEYLPYTALFGPGETRVHTFVQHMLGPVLDWDARRGGPLLETLAAYLDNRLSPVATGRALHLHKNTVLQRLDRIGELLGNDWQQPERLFRLGVAVRVALLAGSGDAHTGLSAHTNS